MGSSVLPIKKLISHRGMETTIDDIIDNGGENYIDKILSFDYDKDGFIRMYRRMSNKEATKVMSKGLHTREGEDKQEVWLSTSLKHSRQFENKIVKDHADDAVIAFRVDLKTFCDNFEPEDIIDQENSSQKNKNAALKDLKNLVNDERLAKTKKKE